MFCHFLQLLGASIFGLALWMAADPGFADWVDKLHLHDYYTGCYILIVVGLMLVFVSFVGCVSAFMENRMMLIIVSDYVAISYTDASNRSISCEISFVLK